MSLLVHVSPLVKPQKVSECGEGDDANNTGRQGREGKGSNWQHRGGSPRSHQSTPLLFCRYIFSIHSFSPTLTPFYLLKGSGTCTRFYGIILSLLIQKGIYKFGGFVLDLVFWWCLCWMVRDTCFCCLDDSAWRRFLMVWFLGVLASCSGFCLRYNLLLWHICSSFQRCMTHFRY